MAIGKDTEVYKQTMQAYYHLINGLVVSIDPSVGSSSSMPGYAVYRQAKLVESGTFPLNPKDSVPVRLRVLANHLRKLYVKYPADVLVFEDIPSLRQGGGNANAHASLLKAVGAILSVPGPTHYVGIMPVSWKRQVSEHYQKGDESDAIEIGRIVLDLACEVEYTMTHPDTSSKKSKKKEK